MPIIKAISLLALATVGLLTICSGCQKEPAVSPAAGLTTGRILRLDQTFDEQLHHPRPRWVVDLAPLSLLGQADRPYSEAKVFALGDTAVYRVGRTVQFHYQLVPYTQQTPWKTYYEYFNMASMPPWTEPRPEITVTDAQVISPL